MPIARVMNNPDGSTPTPPVGGGDSNGTLAASILGAHAGTAASAAGCPRHLKLQSTSLGVPSVATALEGEGMGQAVAIEEGEVSETGIEATKPAPPPVPRAAARRDAPSPSPPATTRRS